MKGKTVVLATSNVQKELYKLLKKKGVDVAAVDCFGEAYTKSFLEDFKNVILPFPSGHENIKSLPDGRSLADFLSPNQLVIGGMITDEIRNDAGKAGAECVDYFKDEAYVLKNAFITSQGALKLFLDSTPDYIAGKKVLITGFGRIGKSLSVMLKNLGMKVFVAVRSDKARVEASSTGFDVLSFKQLSGAMFYFDFIFNTVPEKVFTDRDVKHMRGDAFYFELASKPFGADKADFDEYEKNYVSANGLPGKYYPAAVAENIYSFICSFGGE